MLEKAEQGIYPTVAPLGYRNIGGRDGKKTIEPDPDTAPLVTRLFEWYASGNYSLKDVTTMARAAGLAFRKSGTTVTKSTVHKMLTNPLYYGDFDWTGKRYQGIHAASYLQGIIHPRARGPDGERPASYPPAEASVGFSGTAHLRALWLCHHRRNQKGRYVYYHCTGYKGKCPEKYVREEDIAAQFGSGARGDSP